MNFKKIPKKMIECADYDSMGNHGRFPKPKTEETQNMKRLCCGLHLGFQKIKEKIFGICKIWK